MAQGPDVLEQSIYKRATHRKKPFRVQLKPKKAIGVVPELSSFHKQFLNPKDVADIVPDAMDANINITWSSNLGSNSQIT